MANPWSACSHRGNVELIQSESMNRTQLHIFSHAITVIWLPCLQTLFWLFTFLLQWFAGFIPNWQQKQWQQKKSPISCWEFRQKLCIFLSFSCAITLWNESKADIWRKTFSKKNVLDLGSLGWWTFIITVLYLINRYWWSDCTLSMTVYTFKDIQQNMQWFLSHHTPLQY